MTATNVDKDLIAYLTADTALQALVGQRVYPVARPQGSARPAVEVSRIYGAPEYADDGEVGLQQARFQVDCWGDDYASAKNTGRAVTARLSAVRDVTQGTTTFLYIMLDNEQDLREGGSGEAEYLFRTLLDFTVVSNF